MKELVSYMPQNSVQDADPPFLDQFFSINSCPSLQGLRYAEIAFMEVLKALRRSTAKSFSIVWF